MRHSRLICLSVLAFVTDAWAEPPPAGEESFPSTGDILRKLHTAVEKAVTGGGPSWRGFALGGIFPTAAPDLSSDESKIVFSSPKTGHGDLYVHDLSSNEAKRLTATDDTELSPRFRPRHQQIVFHRETDRCRHIWLRDLATGTERQLSQGAVLDDICDVSPSGEYLLVNRSALPVVASRQVAPFLWHIESGTKTALPADFSGTFRGSGETILGFQAGSHGYRILEVGLDGKIVKNHGTGFTVYAIGPRGNAITIAPVKDGRYEINSDLVWWDLETDKREPIGRGSSVVMFENGKVLFFTEYGREAWVWQSGKQPRKIEGPPAVVHIPPRVDGNRAAVSWIWQADDELHLSLFDAESERFESIKWFEER